MDVDADDVKMVVVDGVVIAPMVNYINNFIVTYTNFIFQALCISKMHQGCYKDLKKEILGNQVFTELLRLMMIMKMLKFLESIILDLLNITASKLFVHPVVLSLHGQNLINLSFQQIFSIFWNQFILQKNLDLHIFAFIKLAKSFRQLFQMEVGISGKKLLILLLMLIIISIITH